MLHVVWCGASRSQAKEGEQEDKEQPMSKWEPTTEGYIQFLVDSKHVYEIMEDLMKEASNPSCKCPCTVCSLLK